MKKNYCRIIPGFRDFWNSKLVTTMRLTVFALLLGILHGYAIESYAQLTRLNLRVKNSSVKEVLNQIEEQSEFYFLYNSKLVNVERQVDVVVKNKSINELLAYIFEGTGTAWQVIDRQIVLTPSEMSSSITAQQPRQVTGKVTDKSGSPLPGVTIAVKGTVQGTITDANGNYVLTNLPPDAVLVFSFVGMKTLETAVRNQATINVSMEDETIGIDEVIAIGYGTQKKVDLTGSVSSINFEKDYIKSRTITNVSTALAGMSTGTFITQSDGLPSGGEATIRIRGTGSLNSSQAPLVIIDGQIGDMNTVAPNDVAEISILKDAASSAIYGSRASNGVILITTKSGSDTDNKVTFNYDGYLGMSSPTQTDELVNNTADHMELINLLQINSGFAAPFTQEQVNEWREKSKTDPIGYPNTDWWDAIIKPNLIQNHNISARGGNKKMNFYTSLNYFNNDGLVNNTAYNKITFRNNLTYKVADWLELGNILTLLMGEAEPGTIADIFQWWRGTTPGMVPKHSDGRYGASQTPSMEFQANNPVHSVENDLGERKNLNYTGKLFAVFTPFKGLSINSSIFLDRIDYNGWSSRKPADRWDFRTETIVFDQTSGAILSVSNFDNKTERTVFDLFADYNITIGSHAVHLLAGYNQEYYKYTTFSGSRNELLSLDIPVLNAATGTQTVAGSGTDYAMMSFFGRANYAFKDKYLFESNLRYDGSSRFAPNNRWGLFPSFSVGWRVSEEPFWDGIKTTMKDLKLRVSWGQLGNNGIGNYDWQNVYQTTGYSYNGKAVPAIVYNSIANDRISWETTNVFNAGADIKLFEKVSATIDFYDKYTKGILANLPIPYVNGGITAPGLILPRSETQAWRPNFSTGLESGTWQLTWA